MIGEHEFYMIM